MEGGRVYGGSDMTLMLQNKRLHTSSELLQSLWQSNSSPSPSPSPSPSFPGSTSMVRFKDASGGGSATDGSLFPSFIKKEEDGNEDYESYFHQPEKKRRLRAEQVQFLEKHFEVENKLEPERKVDLAKELGLQPRQVAIWFQNRRARYKTKQLEKDYDSLKASYDKLKADYDRLLMEKEKLKNEVLLLTDKVLLRETMKENSEPTEPIRPIDAEPEKPMPQIFSPNLSNVPMAAANKQLEDASSARSDVFDSSDSPHYTDANHASLLEPANSSHVFEPDHSDNSHDEEDNLSRSLLPPPCFPKLEHVQPANYCGLGFPVEEQPSWLWPY